jgi:small subunit ribosomal protein S11
MAEVKTTEKIAKKEADKKSEVLVSGETSASAVPAPKKKKKKIRHQIQKGQAHIQCTYNNTLISVSDMDGQVLAWSSSGQLGFKGAKKATSYAATKVVADLSDKVGKYGISKLEVFVKGVGSGREASVRALANKGFDLVLIKDITPNPHNGCRPKKPRRV